MTLEDVIRTLSRTEACLWEQYDTENNPEEKEIIWKKMIETHETMEEVKWLKDHEMVAKIFIRGKAEGR